MSDSQKPRSEAMSCPLCGGEMAENETFCAKCRAELEKTVMSARAEDYPPPARVVPDTPEHSETFGMSSPLDARLDSATDTEIDLLPLAPPEDFSRPTGLALKGETVTEKAAPAVAARPSAAFRPVPAAVPVEMDTPASALRPHQGWKYAVIAVVVILAAGLLGALVWSLVVPSQAVETEAANIAPAQQPVPSPAKP